MAKQRPSLLTLYRQTNHCFPQYPGKERLAINTGIKFNYTAYYLCLK